MGGMNEQNDVISEQKLQAQNSSKKVKSGEEAAQRINKFIYSYSKEFENIEKVKEENVILRETVSQLREEVERYRMPALMVAETCEVFDKNAIIRIPNGNKFYVSIGQNLKGLQPGDSVLVEQKNLTIIQTTNTSKNFDVEKFIIIEKPTVGWADIGGLGQKIEEIKEVIELPLLHPEIFRKVGITPPKGILLHGPPGTGKTLLAKAVANSSNATFIELVASELVQKFIGEGAKLVKEIFDLARARAPAIVFIDEIDALAARRIDIGTSGEREVQRTFMQFLAEIDGFKPLDNVKIIGCTNRKELLDPAIVRPGRLDRLIEIENPGVEGIMEILKIHTKVMSLDKVSLEQAAKRMEGFSGADIKASCTEAGYAAIRSSRVKVTQVDFLEAIEKVRNRNEKESKEYKKMFG